MRDAGWKLGALALAAGTLCCAGREPMRGQEQAGLDRKLATYAWIEEGDLASVIVGTRAARYRDGANYVPIEIAIANRGLRVLELTRESFTLIDEQGNRYPCASPSELMSGYEFLDLDRDQLAELRSITLNRFATFHQQASKFSPTRDVRDDRLNVVRDRVALPKFAYIIDYIYFPKPPTGIKGHRFELFVESAQLPSPLFVKFRVE